MAAIALNPNDPQVRRNYLTRREANLRTDRSTWDTDYRDIAAYIHPQAGRWIPSNVNIGGRRDVVIYDNTATFAVRTLAAGMMSGITSPARPWFKLGLRDKDLARHRPVKVWLYQVAELMREVFAASNTYQALHSCYEELGAFGTWADLVLPNFRNVIHHYPMTVGEYALATDAEGKVDTITRKFQMSVGQLVGKFGRAKCSSTVQNMYDRGQYDAYLDVIHVVQPRRNRDTRRADAQNMAWESVYFEPAKEDFDRYLQDGGFKQFPGLCPRWKVIGGDVYGRAPGMDALGDAKALQFKTARESMAIDLQTNPPLQVPVQYKDQVNGRLPGGVMYVDQTSPGGGVRSAYDVNIQLDALRVSIESNQQRIRNAFYTDLFLMLANDNRSGTTATEIAERHEEKLLMLGPVLERVDTELLAPTIDITFDRLQEAGALPPPPAELRGGMNIEVEFISVLAQAQRMVSTNGLQRSLSLVGGMAPLWPAVVHKINPFAVVDDIAEAFGLDPDVIVGDDEAQAALARMQQQQAAQQMAASAAPVAQAAKAVSEVDPDNLKNIMSSLQGYSLPQAG